MDSDIPILITRVLIEFCLSYSFLPELLVWVLLLVEVSGIFGFSKC